MKRTCRVNKVRRLRLGEVPRLVGALFPVCRADYRSDSKGKDFGSLLQLSLIPLPRRLTG